MIFQILLLVDIFSAFDPATHLYNSFLPFWITPLLLITFALSTYWLTVTPLLAISTTFHNFVSAQLNRTSSGNLSRLNWFISTLFLYLIFINLLGLTPYTFSFSSHLFFTLRLGLPLWITLILSSFKFKPYQFSAHLLPGGAPSWLNPALVLIETISILVRPITLSFRLAANMRAGHIVLGLIALYIVGAFNSSIISYTSLIILTSLYTLFEVGISLIQAYIFCLLLSLYRDEHTK